MKPKSFDGLGLCRASFLLVQLKDCGIYNAMNKDIKYANELYIDTLNSETHVYKELLIC